MDEKTNFVVYCIESNIYSNIGIDFHVKCGYNFITGKCSNMQKSEARSTR